MLITIKDLKKYTGWDQEARIITWLNDHGIKWHKGEGGHPLTTLTQIDASLSTDDWELDHGG